MYLFDRFLERLPHTLGKAYEKAVRDGIVSALDPSKKWLKRSEQVNAPHVALAR